MPCIEDMAFVTSLMKVKQVFLQLRELGDADECNHRV